MEDGPRMRIKSNGRWRDTNSFGPFDHRLHDSLVTEMQSVENTERKYRRPNDVSVLGSVKYLHNLKRNSILGGSIRQTRKEIETQPENS